jgi:probable HAF family extracellular repeat protein
MRITMTAKPHATFVAGLLMAVGQARAQPTITNLGVLPGSSPAYAYASAISADGQVVAGYGSSSAGTRAFRWTAGGGIESLGVLAGFSVRSSSQGLSADGSVIVCVSEGSGNVARACRWTAAAGMQSLGVLGSGSASYARAVSADGSVVVGSSYNAGFTGAAAMRWTSATGMQPLGGTGSAAAAITPDGSVELGTDIPGGDLRAARWTAPGVPQHLSMIPGADSAEAYTVSADGTIAAGHSGDAFNGTYDHAVRWTGLPGSGGVIQDLGTLGASTYSRADAMSADGAVVGGVSTVPSGDHAFLWTAGLGMVDLNTYLPSLGVDLTGWTLADVRGISGNGSALVGNGTFNGADRAFLLRSAAGWPQCAPALSAQPQDASACASGSAAFTVAASGAGALSYDWQARGTAGGPWQNLTVAPAALPCGGTAFAAPFNSPSVQIGIRACAGASRYQIRCVVSNDCSGTASNEATYTVCYPNCDCSTGAPTLNIGDFTCFLQRFALSDPYANCDASTATPTLNVADFSCFLQNYAAGCP